MKRREFIAGLSASWPLYDVVCMSFAAADVPKVVFFGFQLINTSVEPTALEEEHRISMLDDLFRRELAASGRFRLASIPDALQEQIASGPDISNCNGCQREYTQKAGGDWAAWGTVQKVSNLILNINLYMEDEHSGKLQFAKSVDIRGNTDESWRRGLDYLLHNYLLAPH
jgi:Protein of unknown function (DUF2380)